MHRSLRPSIPDPESDECAGESQLIRCLEMVGPELGDPLMGGQQIARPKCLFRFRHLRVPQHLAVVDQHLYTIFNGSPSLQIPDHRQGEQIFPSGGHHLQELPYGLAADTLTAVFEVHGVSTGELTPVSVPALRICGSPVLFRDFPNAGLLMCSIWWGLTSSQSTHGMGGASQRSWTVAARSNVSSIVRATASANPCRIRFSTCGCCSHTWRYARASSRRQLCIPSAPSSRQCAGPDPGHGPVSTRRSCGGWPPPRNSTASAWGPGWSCTAARPHPAHHFRSAWRENRRSRPSPSIGRAAWGRNRM